MAITHTNETYRIRVESPLLRPGIQIETDVSSKYLVSTLLKLLDQVREINDQLKPKTEAK